MGIASFTTVLIGDDSVPMSPRHCSRFFKLRLLLVDNIILLVC